MLQPQSLAKYPVDGGVLLVNPAPDPAQGADSYMRLVHYFITCLEKGSDIW